MSMISMLKTECGNEFTRKCQRMFEDIELSKERKESFKQSSQPSIELPTGIRMKVDDMYMISKDIELSKEIKESFKQSLQPSTELPTCFRMKVDVLAKWNWPTYPHVNVRLPHELNESQTVVLMLFNDAEMQSFQDIKDSTGIEDKELRRTLQSLACGKVRILNKIPRGREVEDDDLFEYNNKFTDKRNRVKLNAFKMKETVEESSMVHETVIGDHTYQGCYGSDNEISERAESHSSGE
ncbi:hypothetical protein ACE6H2_017264 [Prunus campanulata]